MRRRGPQFFLKNINDVHMRCISAAEGDALCEGGSAVRVYRRHHGKAPELIGYKLKTAVNPPSPGDPTIKVSEVLTNAGLNGESRTAQIPEQHRSKHVNRRTGLVEEEDFIERAQGKVKLWPLEGDTKAPLARPRADVFSRLYAAELEFLRRIHPN
jgi:hypothetical protein